MTRSRNRRAQRQTTPKAADRAGGASGPPPRRGRRAAPPPTNRGGRWLLIGVAALALTGLAAVVVRGVATDGSPSATPGPASTLAPGTSGGTGASPGVGLVTGASLPAYDSAGADPAVGSPIPSINGTDLSGAPLAIPPDDGRPKVILFLTHWCSHCQAEVPRIQSWLNETGGPAAVDLYAVSTAADPARPNYPPTAWLQREGWTVPTVVDDASSTIAEAFGLSAFPYWVFVDADGNVALRAAGEISIADLEAILAGLAG